MAMFKEKEGLGIVDSSDFDTEYLEANISLRAKRGWRKRGTENPKNWEDNSVIYSFQRLSS